MAGPASSTAIFPRAGRPAKPVVGRTGRPDDMSGAIPSISTYPPIGRALRRHSVSCQRRRYSTGPIPMEKELTFTPCLRAAK